MESDYKIREILNPDGKPENITKNKDFVEKAYQKRYLDSKVLPLAHQICIYNYTVAIYNWRNDHKIGIEVINRMFATMQRSIFEHYWKLAE